MCDRLRCSRSHHRSGAVEGRVRERGGRHTRQVVGRGVGRGSHLPRSGNQQVSVSAVRVSEASLIENAPLQRILTPLLSVHGEFCFSALPMPPPSDTSETGGRLSGENMQAYMESFAERFLKGKIRYCTQVLNIKRKMHTASSKTSTTTQQEGTSDMPNGDSQWSVEIRDLRTGGTSELTYDRLVLCTGVCHGLILP